MPTPHSSRHQPEYLLINMINLFFSSFFFESERGLFPNTEYVYDLELPLDFMPRNADGEVESFELLTADECIQRALSPQFKTTSAPVLLDFLIRKGYINPENGRYSTYFEFLLKSQVFIKKKG